MTARESSTVWVVVIESSDCENRVRAFATKEAAEAALYEYVCIEWERYRVALRLWAEEAPDTPPTAHTEAIDLYFAAMANYGEFHAIYDLEVEE